MVCNGPDPPDNTPQELTPPSRQDLIMNGNHGEDSDDDQNEYFGYEPLPQGPYCAHSDHENSDNDDDSSRDQQQPENNVPIIEPMETVLAREVWSIPRPVDPIEMNNERAEQVMSAMANFTLPPTSIPEWAQSINEEQWKQNLNDRIEKLRGNR